MSRRPPVIRSARPHDAVDMVPQAIFGRPIQYFTLGYHEAHDDLDEFTYAAFSINNDCHFCLRHCRGHPKKTVTLYLEDNVVQLDWAISQVILGFHMPTTAVQWKRGDPVEFGSVRPLEGRLHESEARILVLKIAMTRQNAVASTSYIKKFVPDFTSLTNEDLEKLPSRGDEERWQQIIRNVISRSSQNLSIFGLGHAVRAPGGIKVTRLGRSFLEDMGFEFGVRRSRND
jgi:hypothetical protein